MDTIGFKTFLEVAIPAAKSGAPVMIRGRHGIGKSHLIRQIADQFGYPMIDLRLSQLEEGDFRGLPDPGRIAETGVVHWVPNHWLALAAERPVVLFLDEIDRGSVPVRAAAFQIGDSRAVGDVKLHPDTLIFAAGNSGLHKHADSYTGVLPMGRAEGDRWVTWDVEPTHDEWLEWARDKIEEPLWDFHNDNRGEATWLDDLGEFEPNQVTPSRRSWVRYNEARKMTGAETSKDLPEHIVLNLARGFVGSNAAGEFVLYLRSYEKEVTTEDVFDKGKLDLIKGWDIPQLNHFITKARGKGFFDEEFTNERALNCARFVSRTPPEISSLFVSFVFDNCRDTIQKKDRFFFDDLSGLNYIMLMHKLNEIGEMENWLDTNISSWAEGDGLLEPAELEEGAKPPSPQLDINTATVAELATLPGVGEVKAKAIVEYREKNGDFGTLRDLTEVAGVSEGTVDKIESSKLCKVGQ